MSSEGQGMNYAAITDVALRYADRQDDPTVTTRIDDFLRLVEARVNRVLQTGNQAKRAYLQTSADKTFYGLPLNYAGMRNIYIKETADDSSGITLDYVTPEYYNRAVSGGSSEYMYTVVGGALQIWPKQDSKVIEMVYYQQLDPLTSSSTTNWLSNKSPDVYIQGLLVEIFTFVRDTEGSSIWEGRFKESLADMAQEDYIDRWSGPTPVIRLA